MRYIDFDWLLSYRTYSVLVTLERISRLIARSFPSLALFGSVMTGVWLFSLHDPRALLSHSTLRGLHILLGLIILFDLLVLTSRNLHRFYRQWQSRTNWRDIVRLGILHPETLLDRLYWLLLVVMAGSGLARIVAERYGVSFSAITPAFGWGVMHSLMAKYFMAALLLRIFLRGTRGVRWLGAYLREP